MSLGSIIRSASKTVDVCIRPNLDATLELRCWHVVFESLCRLPSDLREGIHQ
jgi:hypothetical protein